MKFRSKFSNATYIVRPTLRQIDHLGIVRIQQGLRAEFDRKDHQFDSVQSQLKYGWTDDEREAVEKHLLGHKDYGNGLVLMPGQDIPEGHLKVMRPGRATPESVGSPCRFVEFIDGTVSQCNKDALPGTDKCEDHTEKKAKIVKGMLTA